MATKVVKGGPGILSNLGNLATLGGMVTGQPWLTALGMGMKATDGLINGNNGNSSGSAEDALNKLKEAITGWKNPASGNIAKVAGKVTDYSKAVNPNTNYNELLSRGWGAW